MKKLQVIKGVVMGIFVGLFPTLLFAASILTCNGDTPCTLDQAYATAKNFYYLFFAPIATLVAFMMLVEVATVKQWLVDSSPEMYRKMVVQLRNFVLGTALIWALPPLFVALLSAFNVDSQILDVLRKLTESFEDPLLVHVYAATSDSGLFSAINIEDPLAFLSLVMSILLRWFFIPALIAYWLYSAALLVFAQGSPQKIQLAKGYLWRSIIATAILVLAQGFFIALRATIMSLPS